MILIIIKIKKISVAALNYEYTPSHARKPWSG